MNILISGSTGLIGNKLTDFLVNKGHKVIRLVRKNIPYSEKQIYWNPSNEKIELNVNEKIDAVVHLAGESVGEGRWTPSKKKLILDSRVEGTKLICEAISRLKDKPKVIVSASAIGYYGDRGDEVLTEESTEGNDFLAKVCVEWESLTRIASENGIRVVNARIGIVLSSDGGALKKMLLPFQMGVGGNMGSGKQYMSWIDIDDLVRIFYHCITNENISGPVNAVAPKPVTNAVFTKTLGKVLNRPTLLPAPKFALTMLLGEMGEALLFGSQNVSADKLIKSGFKFHYADLESSLNHAILKKAFKIERDMKDKVGI